MLLQTVKDVSPSSPFTTIRIYASTSSSPPSKTTWLKAPSSSPPPPPTSHSKSSTSLFKRAMRPFPGLGYGGLAGVLSRLTSSSSSPSASASVYACGNAGTATAGEGVLDVEETSFRGSLRIKFIGADGLAEARGKRPDAAVAEGGKGCWGCTVTRRMAFEGMDVEGGVIGIEGWSVVAWRSRSTRWL